MTTMYVDDGTLGINLRPEHQSYDPFKPAAAIRTSVRCGTCDWTADLPPREAKLRADSHHATTAHVVRLVTVITETIGSPA
jgi:hypothetical protein